MKEERFGQSNGSGRVRRNLATTPEYCGVFHSLLIVKVHSVSEVSLKRGKLTRDSESEFVPKNQACPNIATNRVIFSKTNEMEKHSGVRGDCDLTCSRCLVRGGGEEHKILGHKLATT